jgi:hypothetical protein
MKLISGEELIATVTEDSGQYIATDVLQIMSVPDEQTSTMRMGLVDFMPYSNGKGIAIPAAMCIVSFPSEDFLNHYKQKFGRIITPSSKIQLS